MLMLKPACEIVKQAPGALSVARRGGATNLWQNMMEQDRNAMYESVAKQSRLATREGPHPQAETDPCAPREHFVEERLQHYQRRENQTDSSRAKCKSADLRRYVEMTRSRLPM